MSNNAVGAYEDGEKPITKWTKKIILETVQELELEFTFNFDLFSKLTVAQLKKFLICSSWHHTAKYFNKTDFYSIDENKIEELKNEEIEELLKEKNTKKLKPEPEITTAKVKYLIWGGTRNHPTATEYIDTCTVKGNWAYLPNGRKKSLTSNGTEIIETIKI